MKTKHGCNVYKKCVAGVMVCTMLFSFTACGKKVDPITESWTWSTIESSNGVTENTLGIDYPTFWSDGVNFKLATAADRVHEGTLTKVDDNNYAVTYAGGKKVGTLNITGDIMTITLGPIVITYTKDVEEK